MLQRKAVGTVLAATALTALVGCSSGGGGEGGGPSSSSSAPSSAPGSASAPASSSSSGSSSSSAAPGGQGEIDQQLKANPIKFELNKATLNAKSKDTLKSIAEKLAKTKDKVTVTGFVVANSVSQDREKSLSSDRAKAVQQELVSGGVDKGRVTAKGGGAGKAGASAKIEVGG